MLLYVILTAAGSGSCPSGLLSMSVSVAEASIAAPLPVPSLGSFRDSAGVWLETTPSLAAAAAAPSGAPASAGPGDAGLALAPASTRLACSACSKSK